MLVHSSCAKLEDMGVYVAKRALKVPASFLTNSHVLQTLNHGLTDHVSTRLVIPSVITPYKKMYCFDNIDTQQWDTCADITSSKNNPI